MYSKQRQLPLEVSSWMGKDLTLRKITANSRLLTNDTRQNIVLSRQFFTDLMNLSFARYRKMAEHDFDKKMFLRNQQNKSELSMPGLRPYVDQLTYEMNRPAASRIQSSRKGDDPFISTSSQSFLSRAGTKSDSIFNQRQQSSTRQIKTADITKSRPITATVTNPRPPTGRQMSRERLNRLANPKGYRYKSAMVGSDHVRSNASVGAATAEEIFGEIDQGVPPPKQVTILEKPKSAVHDKRFHHLLGVFSEVHAAQTSNSRSCRNIVAANPSLQDAEGQWKMEHPSESNRKTELKHHRQMLVGKLHRKFDVFLVDVGA